LVPAAADAGLAGKEGIQAATITAEQTSMAKPSEATPKCTKRGIRSTCRSTAVNPFRETRRLSGVIDFHNPSIDAGSRTWNARHLISHFALLSSGTRGDAKYNTAHSVII
jgi:hypothetical protein